MPGGLPALDENELAWLAMQPDVESRLVLTDHARHSASYHVEHGPFSEKRLSQLGTEDWTLLVQDVDKHLPDFRSYFDTVAFIPEWRIDDLMVSFAMPGGSVGPHRDNYDVFLCQGSGERCWRVSDDRQLPADDAVTELSLLRPFEPSDTWRAGIGDILYLPPGVAHWGVADSPCMTFSIGMRAPTRAEITLGIGRMLDEDKDATTAPECLEQFYTDADLRAEEADAGSISTATLTRVRKQGLVDRSVSDADLVGAFGAVVTDPKYWLAPDELSTKEAARALHAGTQLAVHGMARLAWFQSAQANTVFVNGMALDIPQSALPILRELHARRMLDIATLDSLAADGKLRSMITWMLEKGLFDVAGTFE